MRNLFIASFVAALLASCSERNPRTVEWFVEHETERESVLDGCAKHAAPSSMECMNAQKAKDSLALKRRGYVKPEPVDFGKEE